VCSSDGELCRIQAGGYRAIDTNHLGITPDDRLSASGEFVLSSFSRSHVIAQI
jgi:hypothetical protein